MIDKGRKQTLIITLVHLNLSFSIKLMIKALFLYVMKEFDFVKNFGLSWQL